MLRLAFVLTFAFCASLAHAQRANDPVALITDIYKTYQGDTNNPGYAGVYSRRLQALIDADAKATPEGELRQDRLGRLRRR